jgi:hypothetical protein
VRSEVRDPDDDDKRPFWASLTPLYSNAPDLILVDLSHSLANARRSLLKGSTPGYRDLGLLAILEICTRVRADIRDSEIILVGAEVVTIKEACAEYGSNAFRCFDGAAFRVRSIDPRVQ